MKGLTMFDPSVYLQQFAEFLQTSVPLGVGLILGALALGGC